MHKKIVAFCLFFILASIAVAIGGTINLPQTGQTKCYNMAGSEIPCAGTGQDGDIRAGVPWPNPRFMVNGDCVTDNLTGLMWARNGNLPSCSYSRYWEETLEFANGLTLCGHSDWRLPNVSEMESLINAAQSDIASWLNTNGFINVRSDSYISSTSLSEYPSDAWAVDLWTYRVTNWDKLWSCPYFLPVRNVSSSPSQLWSTGQNTCYNSQGAVISCNGTGQDGELKKGAEWPIPRFTVNGDCVTDNLTGLIWTRNANLPNGTLNWEQALNFPKGLNICSSFDWRLPNWKELRSLIDHSRFNPALPANNPFNNVHSNYSDSYWSSNPEVSNQPAAQVLGMRWGNTYENPMGWNAYVWPVRTGKEDGPKLINLNISLYANPITDQEKGPYKKIIQYFADGVFEASNGAHRIGMVNIFPDYGNSSERNSIMNSQWNYPDFDV